MASDNRSNFGLICSFLKIWILRGWLKPFKCSLSNQTAHYVAVAYIHTCMHFCLNGFFSSAYITSTRKSTCALYPVQALPMKKRNMLLTFTWPGLTWSVALRAWWAAGQQAGLIPGPGKKKRRKKKSAHQFVKTLTFRSQCPTGALWACPCQSRETHHLTPHAFLTMRPRILARVTTSAYLQRLEFDKQHDEKTFHPSPSSLALKEETLVN